MADVPQHGLERGPEPRLANLVSGRLDPPEGRQRLSPRFGRRHPPRTPRLGFERDVMTQLVVQLAVGAVPVEEHPQPHPPRVPPLLKEHDPASVSQVAQCVTFDAPVIQGVAGGSATLTTDVLPKARAS